jgi:hypothetical protein
MSIEEMKARPFLDRKSPPSAEQLDEAFGHAGPYYHQIMKLSAGYGRTWIFSKSGGWMLKVSDQKKALFYLIPIKDGFHINLTLRVKERETLIHDIGSGSLKKEIMEAQEISEGFVLRFLITDVASSRKVSALLRRLITLRHGA